MQSLHWLNKIWVLALTLGLTVASCTGQQSAVRLTAGALPPKVQAQPVPAPEPAAATTATVQAAYGKLPLSFEANRGQTDARVQFLARGHGYSLFLTPTEAV